MPAPRAPPLARRSPGGGWIGARKGPTVHEGKEERMINTTLACGEETGPTTTYRGCEEDWKAETVVVDNPFGEF